MPKELQHVTLWDVQLSVVAAFMVPLDTRVSSWSDLSPWHLILHVAWSRLWVDSAAVARVVKGTCSQATVRVDANLSLVC